MDIPCILEEHCMRELLVGLSETEGPRRRGTRQLRRELHGRRHLHGLREG